MDAAEAGYPGDVEDLIEEVCKLESDSPPLSSAGVAGYAVVTAPGSIRALLFAVAAGAARDAITLPLPGPSGSAPFLAVWRCPSSSAVLGVAALAPSGSLRVFPSLSVHNGGDAGSCQEIRVSKALALSVRSGEDGISCLATHLVHARGESDMLFVFGERGSAAVVRLGNGAPIAAPLIRDESPRESSSKRGSLSFGSIFYSALRSIGTETRHNDAGWVSGTGSYKICGSGPISWTAGVCVARQGGDVEFWDTKRLVWTFNVFEVIGENGTDRKVVTAGVSPDDTIVLLIEERTEDARGFRIVGFNTRTPSGSAPVSVVVEIDLGDIAAGNTDAEVHMTLSEGLAYIYVAGMKLLSWVSVARGIDAGDQVHGSYMLDESVRVLRILDTSCAAPAEKVSAVSGGVVACLCRHGVILVSSGVPAPVSVDGSQTSINPRIGSEPDVDALLRRALLQFRAGQNGAVRASLRALYQATYQRSTSGPTALGKVVKRTSESIISSDKDAKEASVSLLMDEELERRQEQYDLFLMLMGDPEVFACIRDEASSVADDRLWDALPASVRDTVLMHGEKLLVARRIRDVENAHTSGSSTMFNDTTSTVSASNGGATSVQSIDLREAEDQIFNGISVVRRALGAAGRTVLSTAEKSPEIDSFLYRRPSHFHLFLESLRNAALDFLSLAQAQQNTLADSGITGTQGIPRVVSRILILACEAAITVIRTARASREGNVSRLERDRNALQKFGNWTCTSSSREVLETFIDMVLSHCSGASPVDNKALRKAAVFLSDELLTASYSALCDPESRADSALQMLSPSKRRRLNIDDENSLWGRARARAMEVLRSAGLNDAALDLAEKYRDFNTMMLIKSRSDDFDGYFEKSLAKYGDEFGFYGFRWLEERGEIKLLLKGMEAPSADFREGPPERAVKISNLLSTYFDEERSDASSLSWMHWMNSGNMERACEKLSEHIRAIAVPDKRNSLVNTKVLASIGKLALIACEPGDSDDKSTPNILTPEKRESIEQFISGQLHLARVQERLGAGEDALLKPDVLVRGCIDTAPVEGNSIADRTVIALEAVGYAGVGGTEAQELVDYVWRRCVEREGHIWMQIAETIRNYSDEDLRRRLASSAVFKAALRTGTDTEAMHAIVQRGAFRIAEFEARGRTQELERLVQTTVSLAQGA